MSNITGQIITRSQGEDSGRREESGTSLVMIYGIVEVPNDSPLNTESMQHVITGVDAKGVIQCEIHIRGALDRSDELVGMTPDGAFCMPIWRT